MQSAKNLKSMLYPTDFCRVGSRVHGWGCGGRGRWAKGLRVSFRNFCLWGSWLGGGGALRMQTCYAFSISYIIMWKTMWGINQIACNVGQFGGKLSHQGGSLPCAPPAPPYTIKLVGFNACFSVSACIYTFFEFEVGGRQVLPPPPPLWGHPCSA